MKNNFKHLSSQGQEFVEEEEELLATGSLPRGWGKHMYLIEIICLK